MRACVCVISEKRRKKICAVELDLSCDKDTSTARITFQRQTANGSVCHYISLHFWL